MKSKAVALGHPIHPMLIPFPFAFLTGAVLFDAALVSRPPVVVDDRRSSESGGNGDRAAGGDPRFD